MTKELFINGLKVDLDDSTKMDLQFKSFLFSTISTVQGNRTWTISLPKSSTNLKAIENVQSSDNDSIFPYRKYSVTYYENGFRLINNGNAVLIRISDRIEFCFTFGLILDQMKTLGTKKLTELTELSVDFMTWNRSISYNDMSLGYGWANWWNYTNEDRSLIGTNPDIPSQISHPVVMWWWLLSRIASDFEINLDSLKSYFLSGSNYFIGTPLKSKTGTGTLRKIDSNIITNTSNTSTENKIYFNDLDLIFFDVIGNNKIQKKESNIDSEIPVFIDSFVTYYTVLNPANQAIFSLIIVDKSGVERATPATFTINTTLHSITINVIDFIMLKDDSYFYFKPFYTGQTYYNTSLTFSTETKTATYSNLTTGGFFPIIPNLPDMTCADFILQCSQIAGVFPQINEETPTIISFPSAQTIYDNIPVAKDWSDKLIKKKDRQSELEDVVFTVGSYTKQNTLTYKNGDASTQLVGSINVDNDNLEDTSQLVELKFAAGKRFSDLDNTIDYPLYDIKIIDGVLTTTEKNQSDDIIARVMNIGGINKLFWTSDLQFAGIVLSDNYASYQKIVEKPRYLKENFYLKPQDIQGIDLKIPIYLRQYGKYYAIMNLNYSELTSVCELLEVKNI